MRDGGERNNAQMQGKCEKKRCSNATDNVGDGGTISPLWNTRAEMTSAPSTWYTSAEMIESDALKYDGDDSLHRTTHLLYKV